MLVVKKSKKKIYRKILMSVFFALIFVSLYYVAFYTKIFYVKVTVSGNKNLTQEEVFKIAGLSQEVNLLKIWPQSIIFRLKEDVRLANASWEYFYPRTLRLNVEERNAVAYIQGEYGYFVLDENSVVIFMVKAISDFSKPIITGKKIKDVFIGEKIKDSDIYKAILFLNLLKEKNYMEVSEINVNNEKYVLYTLTGIKFKLGNLADIEKKGEVFLDVVREIREKFLDVEYVDIDFDLPAIKLKNKGKI